MIGTDDGYWFSYVELSDGQVDYEFFQHNERLNDGVCSLDEMLDRFDLMCNMIRK